MRETALSIVVVPVSLVPLHVGGERKAVCFGRSGGKRRGLKHVCTVAQKQCKSRTIWLWMLILPPLPPFRVHSIACAGSAIEWETAPNGERRAGAIVDLDAGQAGDDDGGCGEREQSEQYRGFGFREAVSRALAVVCVRVCVMCV